MGNLVVPFSRLFAHPDCKLEASGDVAVGSPVVGGRGRGTRQQQVGVGGCSPRLIQFGLILG